MKRCSHLTSAFASNFKNAFYGNKWWCPYLTFASKKNVHSDVKCEQGLMRNFSLTLGCHRSTTSTHFSWRTFDCNPGLRECCSRHIQRLADVLALVLFAHRLDDQRSVIRDGEATVVLTRKHQNLKEKQKDAIYWKAANICIAFCPLLLPKCLLLRHARSQFLSTLKHHFCNMLIFAQNLEATKHLTVVILPDQCLCSRTHWVEGFQLLGTLETLLARRLLLYPEASRWTWDGSGLWASRGPRRALRCFQPCKYTSPRRAPSPARSAGSGPPGYWIGPGGSDRPHASRWWSAEGPREPDTGTPRSRSPRQAHPGEIGWSVVCLEEKKTKGFGYKT